ncbi:Hypothetical predicted protein [Marmota monax]|uniref:Uncharacterized protein n=1 Tax=Marmota monax TaxID=9995 RepID=A0A5E4ABA0_MARMO|nr:Hypothetical predicted protein [Marmota monax]
MGRSRRDAEAPALLTHLFSLPQPLPPSLLSKVRIEVSQPLAIPQSDGSSADGHTPRALADAVLHQDPNPPARGSAASFPSPPTVPSLGPGGVDGEWCAQNLWQIWVRREEGPGAPRCVHVGPVPRVSRSGSRGWLTWPSGSGGRGQGIRISREAE